MTSFIHLLGRLEIEDQEGPSPLVSNAKGCALLTYLVHVNKPQPREVVADLLWQATSTAQSLRNLRVLLARVRPFLPELQATRTSLAFRPAPERPVDLLTLVEALQNNDIAAQDAGLLLYQGDLLPGIHLADAPRFNEWLLLTRESLRRQVMTAYDHLCQTYARQQAWTHGVEAARRWLALDDLDERSHRWLMIHLVGRNQIGQALQQYEVCRQRLWQELGVEPDEETTALANQLVKLVEEREGTFDWERLIEITWPPPHVLSEPGPLPPNADMPFQRNHEFIGRREPLLQLAKVSLPWPDAVPDPNIRAVAITGMAGLGKTQLAVEFAYRYGRYFPGGVYWLNFGNAETVAVEVARIGSERGMSVYRESENLSLSEQVGRVRKAWQEQVPRLLIFDNCEEDKLLAEWLPVTGGSRVLVTSRRGQWSRELHVYPLALDVLDGCESTALLQSLVPHLDESDASMIAAALGHLPLALHLAAGFLHRYNLISPPQYLSQLEERGLLRHPSLQGRGMRHSPTGHELHVAHTFALSLAQLDPNDEVDAMALWLSACAACFSPGEPIARDLLHAIALEENPRDELMVILLTEDGLARLVALGFLQAEEGNRVVMHRLLALFVQEGETTKHLTQTAENAVAAQIVRVLEEQRRMAKTLSHLPISVVHLRHVTEAALARHAPLAANLAHLLGGHLLHIGSAAAAKVYLQAAIAAAEENADLSQQVQSLNALSSTHESLGQDEAALENAQRAIELLRNSENAGPATMAEALYRMGWAHFRLGHVEESLAAAQEGHALSEAAQLPSEMARHLSLMGVVNYYVRGDYDTGTDQLEESLALYRQLGNRNGQAAILNNLGESARLQGDFSLAAEHYEAALLIAREAGNRNRERIFLTNWCGAQIGLGNFEEALIELNRLISQIAENWFGLSEAYRFLAEAHLGLGQIEQAFMPAQRALQLAHAENAMEHGRAWRVLGRVAAHIGDTIQAVSDADTLYDAQACFRQSLLYFDESYMERDQAITLAFWAQHEASQGNGIDAEALQKKADEIFKRLNLCLLANSLREN